MGLLDVFSGGDQKAEVKLPKWISGPAQDYIGQSQQIASQPYQPYPYARIAPFSADQQKAFELMRGVTPGGVAPTTTTPESVIADAKKFMNPYTEDVIDAGMADLKRYMFNPEQAALKAKFHQAGAFGDTGYAMAGDLQSRRFEDQAFKFISDLLQSGYDKALSTALGTQNQAFNQNYNATGLNFDQIMRQISGLYGMGQQQQQLGQKSADLSYQDWVNQRDYQKQQLNWLMSVLGNAMPAAGKTTTQSDGGNVAGDIASIASSVAPFFL